MAQSDSTNLRLLNVNKAAELLGVSASYLNKQRLTGAGPIFLKLGRRVAYHPADLAGWLAERRRRSTSAPRAGDEL